MAFSSAGVRRGIETSMLRGWPRIILSFGVTLRHVSASTSVRFAARQPLCGNQPNMILESIIEFFISEKQRGPSHWDALGAVLMAICFRF
jgi:hypothetical protein